MCTSLEQWQLAFWQVMRPPLAGRGASRMPHVLYKMEPPCEHAHRTRFITARDLDGVRLSAEHRGQGLAAFRALGSPRDGHAFRARPCVSCSQTESRDGHDPFRADVPP